MVDPLVGLLDARLAACLEHLDEKVFHVLVGEALLGRDDVVRVLRDPLQIVSFHEHLGVLSTKTKFENLVGF